MFVYMIKAIDEVPNATPKYLVYNPEERGENIFELSSNTMRAFKCINLGMVNNFLYDAHQAFPTEYFEIVTKTSEELGEFDFLHGLRGLELHYNSYKKEKMKAFFKKLVCRLRSN